MDTNRVSDLAIDNPKYQRRMMRWILANLRQLNGAQLNEVLNITREMLPEEEEEEFDEFVLEAAALYEQICMLEALPVSSARPS
jgi:hypothetical protein